MDMRSLINLVEGPDTAVVFHVTYARNLRSIKKKGLIPSVGERTGAAGDRPGIYVFPTMNDCDDAVMNWLGDELDDDEEIAYLQLTVPKEWIVDEGVGYEYVIDRVVPPEMIKLIKTE